MLKWSQVIGGPADMNAYAVKTGEFTLGVVQNKHSGKWSWSVVKGDILLVKGRYRATSLDAMHAAERAMKDAL